MTNQIDVNDLVTELLGQIGEQAKELAFLRVQLKLLTQNTNSDAAKNEEAEDGSDTV